MEVFVSVKAENLEKALSSMSPKVISSWFLWIEMAAPLKFPLWKSKMKNSKDYTMMPRIVLIKSDKKRGRINASFPCMKNTPH